MRLLVTGGTGLLGSFLVPFLRERGHEVVCHSQISGSECQFDATDPLALKAGLAEVGPDVVINLVALTQVDACEDDPQRAYLLNVKSVMHLADWARGDSGRHLLHISTDHVYDSVGPSREDGVTIRNYYALSKFAGELAAATARSTVLRTNFFGRSRCARRASFTDWLYNALTTNTAVTVFDDVLFSPVSIETLSRCIEQAAIARPLGTFNVGSGNGLSKAEFAYQFAAAVGLRADALMPSRSSTARVLKARRPTDMRMDSSRFEQTFGFALPQLVDEITSMRSEYREHT